VSVGPRREKLVAAPADRQTQGDNVNRALALFKAGSAVTRALPPRVAEGVARAAGFGAARVSPERRAQVERNLRRVYGPDFGGLRLRRAVDQTFESYARYWAESFRLPGTSAAALDAGMQHEGIEHLDDALAAGRGAVMAIPHLGGW
jgi:KDO2-lipid IV(A) lauroyltransferase